MSERTTMIFNLRTGAESYHELEPDEALISAAMLDDGKASSLDVAIERNAYRGRIVISLSGRVMGIGDCATIR